MIRFSIIFLLWLIITGGRREFFWIGIPASLVASIVSRSLGAFGSTEFNPRGIISLLTFFVIHSVKGGIDVAWRVMHPGLLIDPGELEYPLALNREPARSFMVGIVSLMPGTLSVALTGDIVRIHVLDRSLPVVQDFEALERKVARLFNLKIPETGR